MTEPYRYHLPLSAAEMRGHIAEAYDRALEAAEFYPSISRGTSAYDALIGVLEDSFDGDVPPAVRQAVVALCDADALDCHATGEHHLLVGLGAGAKLQHAYEAGQDLGGVVDAVDLVSLGIQAAGGIVRSEIPDLVHRIELVEAQIRCVVEDERLVADDERTSTAQEDGE